MRAEDDKKCPIMPKCVDDLTPTEYINALVYTTNGNVRQDAEKSASGDNPKEGGPAAYSWVPLYHCRSCNRFLIDAEKRMGTLDEAVLSYLGNRSDSFLGKISAIEFIGPGSELFDKRHYTRETK